MGNMVAGRQKSPPGLHLSGWGGGGTERERAREREQERESVDGLVEQKN